jgi:signal transduction histidine kinase|tara:strand:- start:394 stop:534 length:141 start_codon:yes stop_codon:yes gene_type:complete
MRNYDSKKNFMGLAIVKHVAQLHQGHVSLESTPGVKAGVKMYHLAA